MLGATLLLGGCNAIPGYAEYRVAARALAQEGIAEYRQYHDDKAAVSLLLLCDNTVGAVARMPDAAARSFILFHCGGGALPAGAGSAVFMGR